MRMNGSNCTSSTATEAKTDVLYFTIKAIICVITTFGNALVIFLVIRCKRLRVLPNNFIVTLAIADMLVGAVITPTEVACKYLHGCNFMLQRLSYDILYHLSTTNLCALTLDRYIATSRPLEYPLIMNKKNVIVITFIAWISASMTPVTAYIFYLHGLSFEALQILDLVLFQILPPVSLGIIYIRMTCIISRLKKKQIQQIIQISYNYGDREVKKVRASATVKITGVIIIVLILCYALAVGRRLYFLITRQDIPYPVVKRLSRTLLNVNSAANVFVYAFLKGDFKRELKRKLRCVCLNSNNNLEDSCEENIEMKQRSL